MGFIEDDDDDIPQLSADTLKMLQDFNSEKEERSKQFEALKSKSENESKLSMDLFGEDWNASQFWYTDETARMLAHQLLKDATPESAIAVVSTPSVYVALRNILSENPDMPRPQMALLEYDQRFEVVGPDFKFYDYQQPMRLPAELKGKFDRIIVDPPFLNEDCQTKAALTARFLAKNWDSDSVRFISCTGERMSGVILKLYQGIGVKTTTYEPKHSKGLSNEFWCYSNISDTEEWTWREF